MMDFLRPVLGRLAAVLIASLVSWLTAKGVDVPAETQQAWIEATVGLMLLVFGVVYAVAHKLINTKVNPTDAAAPSAVTAGKEAQAIRDHHGVG